MKKNALLLLLIAATGLAVLAQTNAPAPAKAAKTTKRGGDTKIQADLGNYDFINRTVIYTGHVHIENADMQLYCAKITSYSPPDGGHPYRIVAETNSVQTNVVINMLDEKGQTNHVTGRLAVYEYSVKDGHTNETVTVTGDPHITSPMMAGTADQLQWDRGSGHMSAINPDFISTQQLDMGMSHTNSPAHTGTNSPAAK